MSFAYTLPTELYRHRWQMFRNLVESGDIPPGVGKALGDAAFGRYVAKRGGVLSPSSPGYRAWARLAYRPGFANRSQRKAVSRLADYYVTP